MVRAAGITQYIFHRPFWIKDSYKIPFARRHFTYTIDKLETKLSPKGKPSSIFLFLPTSARGNETKQHACTPDFFLIKH